MNAGLLAVDNFVPPVFPMAGEWNQAVTNLIPAGVTARLGQLMLEPAAANFSVDEMQMEENAGLGFGVSVLFLASVMAAVSARQKRPACAASFWLAWVWWLPVISLLAVMAESNLAGIARILTPYYLLLLPPLLAGSGHELLVKRTWWRVAAGGVFLLAAGLLIISPARPLFPARSISEEIWTSNSRLLARIKEVYSVYRSRNDGFAPARAALPPDLKVLGLVTFDDPETSLWRPFGSRRIEHVMREDTAADLKARGIEYILVKPDAFGGKFLDGTSDEWCARMNATIVQKIPLNLRAAVGATDWHLIRLN